MTAPASLTPDSAFSLALNDGIDTPFAQAVAGHVQLALGVEDDAGFTQKISGLGLRLPAADFQPCLYLALAIKKPQAYALPMDAIERGLRVMAQTLADKNLTQADYLLRAMQDLPAHKPPAGKPARKLQEKLRTKAFAINALNQPNLWTP